MSSEEAKDRQAALTRIVKQRSLGPETYRRFEAADPANQLGKAWLRG